MLVGLLVVSVALVGRAAGESACAAHASDKAPGGSPDFQSEKIEGVEVRSYPAAEWATTFSCDGSRKAFKRLFNYISGSENAAEQEVDMTAPVLMSYKVNEAGGCSQNMSFFGPQADQGAMPQPTNGEVSIVSAGFPRVAVHCYTYPGGWIRMGWEWMRGTGKKRDAAQLAALRKAVAKAGLAVKGRATFTAGYTDPGADTQYKEVWLPLE